ncbi:MAG: hypothetical protein AAB544_03125, partial [Patescibacteria group bacterium]
LIKGNLTSRGTLSGAALTVMGGTSYLMGNVGIGTTSPLVALHVKGSAATEIMVEGGSTTNGADISYRAGGTYYWAVGKNGAGADFEWYDYQGTAGTRMVLQSSTGNLGIGTTTPTEKLEIIGTASGRILHAQDSLTSSGTLVWEGSASGASLWVSSFEGAGLTDCDASTQKVIWDDTLNKFSCGTDSDTTYTAAQGLTLNGSNAFSLSSSFSGTALEILGTASGRILHAQDELRSSGSLIVQTTGLIKGNLTSRGTLSGAALTVMGGTSYLMGNVGIGTTSPLNKFHTNLTTGQLALFGGTALGISDQNYAGIVLGYSEAGPTYQKSAIVQMQTGDAGARGTILFLNNNGLNSTNASLSDARMAITAAGNIGIGTTTPTETLEIIGTASGRILHAQDSLTSSGTLVWEGSASGASLWVSSFE